MSVNTWILLLGLIYVIAVIIIEFIRNDKDD